MKKLSLVVLFALSLAAFRVNAATVTVQFLNHGTSIPYHGAYAGEYNATVNGVNTSVVCDDFLTEIVTGQTWVANEFTYADIQNGAVTKFVSSLG